MKREELYNKVMEISKKYSLPVSINKKTKKAELQKMYNNMSKLSQEEELIENEIIDNDDDNDIQRILEEYPLTDNDDSDKENVEVEIEEEYKASPKQNNKRKLKSVRMTKILKTQSINTLKKEINTIISKYNKETDGLMDMVEKLDDVTEDEINVVINTYNEIREDAENEINLCIDTYKGSIPESFYVWVESQLDRKKTRLEKIIS
jgi:hypothetical protein